MGFPKKKGTLAFDLLDQFVYSVLRIDLKKNMDMIWHHLHGYDFRLACFANLQNNGAQIFLDEIGKNFSAIFWAKNDMIFTAIYHIAV